MSGRRLYIGRIPQEATRPDFEDFFGRIGKVIDIRIMAGFAFLEYEDLRVSPARRYKAPVLPPTVAPRNWVIVARWRAHH